MDRSTSNSDLKQILENQIHEMEKNKEGKSVGFIPVDYLKEEFYKPGSITFRKVKEQLENDFSHWEPKERENLQQAIQSSGGKLYAILILLDETHKIFILMDKEQPVNDSTLFGNNKERSCNQDELSKIPQLRDIAPEFYKKQWIIPPVLCSNEEPEFPIESFIFPFSNDPAYHNRGSYGLIFTTEIASGHLRSSYKYQTDNKVAYKRVSKGSEKADWKRLLNETKTLRARQHENITPLLASFSAGAVSQSMVMERYLYMIFPLAVMNLEEWMKKKPDYIPDPGYLRHHVYHEMMLKLASGLAYIHKEIDNQVGYHRDLKPANILLFKEPNYIWKICDFGTSNLKPADNTVTQNTTATPYYAPSEFFEDKNSTKGETHGRAHDVYSLGCVLLELATILKNGWGPKGLKAFEKLRAGDDNYERKPDEVEPSKTAFHKCDKAIKSWCKHLKDEPPTPVRRNFGPIVSLIEEMLSPIDRRLQSWEVYVYLFIQVEDLDIQKRVDEKEILQELEKVVQRCITIPDKGSTPWTRAKSKSMSPSFLKLLEDNDWTDFSPTSTQELSRQASKISSHFSTLPDLYRGEPLFGRVIEHKHILECFQKTNSVALYGLGGTGKSRLAFHYAQQCKNSDNKSLKKHTFWIQASGFDDIHNSLRDIARAAQLPEETWSDQEKCAKAVKSWLNDKSKGPWLIVIDGLKHKDDVETLQSVIPINAEGSNGQLLITTRNRLLVRKLMTLSNGCIIKVSRMEPDDSKQLFLHHLDGAFFNPDPLARHTTCLLELLWFPVLIKKTAEYMNEKMKGDFEMLRAIEIDAYKELNKVYPDFLQYILEPLIEYASPGMDSLEDSSRWPREIRLLFILSFFSKKCVDKDLIAVSYRRGEERDSLEEMISTLTNCEFISKETLATEDDSTPQVNLIMNETVRSVILRWIEANEGKEGLLQRYNTALYWMNSHYERTKSIEGNWTKSTYHLKLPFIPHFECFNTFITKKPNNTHISLRYELTDESVWAILKFSKVWGLHNRHEDVIRVLEFARAHYRVPDIATFSGNRAQKYRTCFWIGTRLVKAYLSRSADNYSPDHCHKAEKLVIALLEESRTAVINHGLVKWAGDKLQRWQLELDMVRVHRAYRQWIKARDQLDVLRKLMVRIENGEPVLPEHEIDAGDSNSEPPPRIIQELRRFSIQVKREEALIHLAEYRNSKASKSLAQCEDARRAFLDVKTAIEGWFSDDDGWLLNAEVDIAEANMEIGTHTLLGEARDILERKKTRILTEFVKDCEPAREIEAKLYTLQIRLDSRLTCKRSLGRELAVFLFALIMSLFVFVLNKR